MNSTAVIRTEGITLRSLEPADRLIISGRVVRIAQPHSEPFYPLEDPELFLKSFRPTDVPADLFTFAQRVSEPMPRFSYCRHLDTEAVLEVETFEKWWKQTVNDKTRNMVRKAGKKGVSIEVADYTDDLVHGIKRIYDECPVRQGKKSRHYGKNFEQIRTEHATFLDRSEFIAAHFEGRLIGFAKVVFESDFASIMNLIALIGERDKAPTNALLAKVVERCASRGINLLHYGVWSRRGFGDFKLHHGFKCRHIPRYYIPLTTKGDFALRLGLHRPLTARLPEPWIDWLAAMRTRWYAWRYPMK
jgi:hypothetical protein